MDPWIPIMEFKRLVNGPFPLRCKTSPQMKAREILDGARRLYYMPKYDGHSGTIALSRVDGEDRIEFITAGGIKDPRMASQIPRDAFDHRAYKARVKFRCEACAMVWHEDGWCALGYSAVPSVLSFLCRCDEQGISGEDQGLAMRFYIYRLEELLGRNCGLLDDDNLVRERVTSVLVRPTQSVVVPAEYTVLEVETGGFVELDGKACSLWALPDRLARKAQEELREGFVVNVIESSSISTLSRNGGMFNGHPRLNNSFKAKKIFYDMVAAVFKYIDYSNRCHFVLCLRDGHSTMRICGRIGLANCGGDVRSILSRMIPTQGRSESAIRLNYTHESNMAVRVSCAWISKNGHFEGIKPIMEALPRAHLNTITYFHTVTREDAYWCAIVARNELADEIMSRRF